MGCSCSKDPGQTKTNDKKSGQTTPTENNNYSITITLPDRTFKANFEFEKNKVLLYDLVNAICFSSKYSDTLNANFISKYNEEIDDFEYYIESLLDQQIENESCPERGKMWMIYINENKETWSEICRKNRIINSGDNLEFVYEYVD